MIEDFCAKASGADIAIALVERERADERASGHEADVDQLSRAAAYSGANLFLLASPKVAPAIALWRAVEQDRKKGWRLLSALGPVVLLGAVLRLLTLDQVLARVGAKLGLRIQAVEMADPLAAVDVDKARGPSPRRSHHRGARA